MHPGNCQFSHKKQTFPQKTNNIQFLVKWRMKKDRKKRNVRKVSEERFHKQAAVLGFGP